MIAGGNLARKASVLVTFVGVMEAVLKKEVY